MALALGESLLACDGFVADDLFHRFLAAFTAERWRGWGERSGSCTR
jgi:hypothetical protein